MSDWFHTHAHTNHSALDGMRAASAMVAKAAMMGQPAIAFTDHGNMAATVEGYKAAQRNGILFFPGIEAYLADPDHEGELTNDLKRFHVGLLARDLKGYQALVRFTSKTHTRPRFSRFPRCTFLDLIELGKEAGDHLVLTTGCYFGLVQQLLYNEGPDEAKRAIKAYARWFPNTYVEIQNHNITHDDGTTDADMVERLVELAHEVGLPILATQDSHYLDQSEKEAHALMKRMVYGGKEDEFPGDSFHLATDEWVAEHYDAEVWKQAVVSCQDLVDMHELSIPPLDKFKVHMPWMAKNPFEKLRDRVMQIVGSLNGPVPVGANRGKYIARANEELSVIKDTGFADYFLHWDKAMQYARKEGICVEARGSANGCLVLFLLGVTSVDPVKWGCSYERFISRDRIKPPDVDLDIEDGRRDQFVRYLGRTFTTMRIGTWGKIGITIDEVTGEERGSVLVTYLAGLRRECEVEAKASIERRGGKKGDAKGLTYAIFKNRGYDDIKSIEDVRRVSRKDYRALKRMDTMEVFKSYGQHAGGVLLGPDDIELEDYIPTMLVGSSDAVVTQYDMDAVEEFGLLKDDILGQSSLTVMRVCQELMGIANPTDFSWIPDNDKEACKHLRSGGVDNGIFHFEGWTKARGGREMGVKSTKDAIIASALYMPGCVDSGQKDKYISTRRSPRARQQQIEYAQKTHPLVYEVLAETNGVMVFQEHPLQILRKLGMSVADVNITYKILKDSGRGAVERNRARLAQIKDHYNELCNEKGVNGPEELWKAITGFMAYGFNKAHSTGYGIRSYRTAYLKAHYPLEFMTALLKVWAGRKTNKKDREAVYVREARRIGLRILPPDVNLSGASWTMDRKRNAIRRGLLSIKGIGPAGAARISSGAPYADMDDLINRMGGDAGRKNWLSKKIIGGQIKVLKEAGALDCLEE